MDSIFYPIVLFVAAGIFMIVFALYASRKANRRVVKGYHAYAGRRYIQSQFSNQFELDMRLPYREFKHLYPESRWTYEEYKKMQMQTAFRRSFSSQDNKRMVR